MSKANDSLVRSLTEIAETLSGNPFASRDESEEAIRRALREGRILYDPPWAFSVPRPGASAGETDRWIATVADDMQESDPALSRMVAEEKARDMLAWEWRHSSIFTEEDFRDAEAAAALIQEHTGVSHTEALGQVLSNLRESRVSQGLRELSERPLPCQRIGA